MTVAFRFAPVSEADFERLLDLSIRVMREGLERVGRFDPARRRARMRAGFDPAAMRLVMTGTGCAGCVAVAEAGDHREIHSFYLEPQEQGRGLGRAVLDAILAERPDLPHRLEVLKESPAQRFYERAGFLRAGESEWDVQFERPARGVRTG